jgi:hypothetical protein
LDKKFSIKDIPATVFAVLGQQEVNSPSQKITNIGTEYTVFEMKNGGFIAYAEQEIPEWGSRSARFEIWHRLPKKGEGLYPKIEIRAAPFWTGTGPTREYREQVIVLFPSNAIISENDLSKPIWALVAKAIQIASELASSPNCEEGATYRDKYTQELKTKT